ncbi:MAG TPA: metallopeptidase TldD-related protein [Anaerolineales bacterium]|nr:metallopeptidase TldD-related protein [Anaerolineales bacterium]
MAEPLDRAVEELTARKELLGWTVTHRRVRGEQLFADRQRVEARRSIESDQLILDALCTSDGASEPPGCGAASATVTAGEDPGPAIEFAIAAARRTRNQPYSLPSPAPLPDVDLADPVLQADLSGALRSLHERLDACASRDPAARLTLAEWFAEAEETHLVNSQGIDARQSRTELSLEWIVLAGQGQERVETLIDLDRRRLADLDVEAEWEEIARQTADRHSAGAAPMYTGPVVLRGNALRTFLNSGPFQTLGSGRSRFSKLSPWEPGHSIFRGEVRGDPLTVWATRVIPYGKHASRFDEEGLAGQRVLLVDQNVFRSYSASQRYATYLSVPATGSFGDIEVPPGSASVADLIAEPHVEVITWSDFSPEPTIGDFAAEIRLGYHVENGRRRPFSGGLLVGNLFDALADVRWSAETGFFGSYLGPTTARFASLQVTPSRAT